MSGEENQGEFCIKDENESIIRKSIDSAASLLLSQIDFNSEKAFYTQVVPLELYDAKKNKLECEMMILFAGKLDDDSNKRQRQLAVVITPKGQLHNQRYLGNLQEFKLTDEVAIRYWRFLNYLDETDLNITSNMKTNLTLEGCGIGSAVLFASESLMDDVSEKFALHFNLSETVSTIIDGSERGWTTKRMSNLPGYLPIKGQLGNGYKKVRTY